ncbi:MAG TPA: cytochrome c oxidase subunit II [Gemmatimonadaceae bacterium]|jgi:cytochrome c oxidase subunit 2
MPFHSRPRRLAQAALTVALVALLAACGQNHPDSIFHRRTDFNRDVDYLFKVLIYAGTAVFIFVEGILVLTLIKFRKRPGQPEPEHVHGNTTLEIAWTVIPLLILILIGIPTVRTIFKTEAVARSDALQVEVVGHQWWWEFRYPQYTTTEASGKVDTVVTANELYLPIGKTVNFTLHSRDVIHSFWIPALGGKRDVVTNHTNYLWMTPDSVGSDEFNGACAEYCGTSHANMRFKAFTVTQADFDSWIAHQEQPAVGSETTGPALSADSTAKVTTATPGVGAPPSAGAVNAQVAQAGFIAFPRDKIPASGVPETPLPAGLTFDDNLLASGNVENGKKLVTTGMCIACHTEHGVTMMQAVVGPNLTHVGSRTTIAGAMYPNDPRHLARWIKFANGMKPGVGMPTFGIGQYDPVTLKGIVTAAGGFTDAQIADIVAYLTSLK